MQKREALENVLIPYTQDENEAMLKEAGFKYSELLFRWANFALFIAYKVYEKYLGEEVAKNLPAIGIEFPLIIQKKNETIARAVLSVHDDGSLSFAGDFKKGDSVTFGYGDV